MKKPTIVAFMLMTCILLNGQEKKKEKFVDDLYGTNTPSSISGLKTRTIGDELQLYSRHYYTGFGTSLLGTGLLLVGYNLNTNESGKGKSLMIAGGIITCIGSLITLESSIHIGKAGVLLNENGIGLKILIPNK